MIIIGTIDNNMMSNSITRIQLQPSNYLQISIAHLKMKVGEYEIFIYIISNVALLRFITRKPDAH